MDGGNRAHASTRRTRSPLLLPSLPAWCVFVCHTQFHGLFSYSVSFLPRVRLFVCVCGGGVVRSLLFVCFCFVSVCSPLFVCRFFVGVCFCGVLCVFCRVLCSFCLPEARIAFVWWCFNQGFVSWLCYRGCVCLVLTLTFRVSGSHRLPNPSRLGCVCVCVVCLFVPAGKKTQQTQVLFVSFVFCFCLCHCVDLGAVARVTRGFLWNQSQTLWRPLPPPPPPPPPPVFVLVCGVGVFVCLFVCVTDSFLCLFVCWLVTTIFGVWEWGLGLWLGITHDTQRDIRAEGGGTICLNQPHHIQSTQKQSFCEP